MKHLMARWMMVLFGLAVVVSCARKVPQEIKWASSLDDALKIASEKNQHIIADFWSEG